MCCLCSDRVTAQGVYQEVGHFSRIFNAADVPPTVNVAIALRVIVQIAQSRDAYRTVVEQHGSAIEVDGLVSDYIYESIDYANTFESVDSKAIDAVEIRRVYVVFTRALSLCEIAVSNTVSVAFLAMSDALLSKVKEDAAVNEIVESHVMMFNAEKDYADPSNYGAGFDGN